MPPTQSHNPRRILVIRDGRVGDMLMTTPVVRWLAGRYPDARLDVLTGPYGKIILEENPAISELIVYDKGAGFLKKLGVWMKLLGRYDLAVVLESTSPYVILSWLIGAKHRIGISGRMNRLLHGRHPWNHSLHTIRNNLSVLAPLQANQEPPRTDMALHLTAVDRKRAREFLQAHDISEDDPVVFIQPSCGPNELLRPWPPEHVASLADMTAGKLGAKVILNAGPREWERVDEVARLAAKEMVINDTEVRTTAALIAASSAVVTPDTGTLHMASALGTPVVALFGPSRPENYGPMGEGAGAVLDRRFECSPCAAAASSSPKQKCLEQGQADCMRAISVDEVFERLVTLIGETNVSNQ